MKYIVSKTCDIIIEHAPKNPSGETMIRVDGFEDIRFYEKLSREISEYFKNKQLDISIKLAKNKYDYFMKDEKNSLYLKSMKENGWVTENESMTRYRNLHKSNLLILLGTEVEEDKGGLLNCYCINPDTITSELRENYSEVFTYLNHFIQDEKNIINKLYSDLFTFVPFDIYELSKMADEWENNISNIDDFIKLFYENLNRWGLPIQKNNLPSEKDFSKKNNLLAAQYKFINRLNFKKVSQNEYKKIKDKFKKYDEHEGQYGSNWAGWSRQPIKSYNELEKVILEFIIGENFKENRELLLKIDYDIVNDVLNFKKKTESSPKKNTEEKLKGEPLSVFMSAFLYSVASFESDDIKKVTFDITQAEIVPNINDGEDNDGNKNEEENNDALIKTWNSFCFETNGVVELLNQNMWEQNAEQLEINLEPADIFLPQKASEYVSSAIIKRAGANKVISKIKFVVECESSDNKVEEYKFVWEIPDNSAWLHEYDLVCNDDKCNNNKISFVPLASSSNIRELMHAQSEEEFFDKYDESEILFDLNLCEFVKEKTGFDIDEYVDKFDKLGYSFTKFISCVEKKGFVASFINEGESPALDLVNNYTELGKSFLKNTLPENLGWLLDTYIHSFNIEEDSMNFKQEKNINSCIVPPWHPATIQKKIDQINFFIKGCKEWWNETNKFNKTSANNLIEKLEHMCNLQNTLDIFPASNSQYFGVIASYGAFSLYEKKEKERSNRLKDIMRKDAIYDDDFDDKQAKNLNDNAKMIYEVIEDYIKAFQNDNNMNIVFINPSELQPIVAALHNYINEIRKNDQTCQINISLKILVKPENKGGRNYLAFWMDELFSKDEKVNIRTYLNEYKNKDDLDSYLNGNNDIVFVMNLLKDNSFSFIRETKESNSICTDCTYPVVYKPAPVSSTSVRRKIELSQSQFSAAYTHTQIVHYRNNMEMKRDPNENYIVVREVSMEDKISEIVHMLHEKAYWVVCVDSGLDGALLKNDGEHKDDYSIIGFSTGKGKGVYGEYNITITERKSILTAIQSKLAARLTDLFKWKQEIVKKAAQKCIEEAGKLDGISLFSAINPKDQNIHEFMAYVLTSLRERKKCNDSALSIMIHLDSYKHWFDEEISGLDDKSKSRPDFLLLEANIGDGKPLNLKATVIECKIAIEKNKDEHEKKAIKQVNHGIERLSKLFDPNSDSVRRRYWFAQLYRALAFAQVTFSNDSKEFEKMSSELRNILEGNFEISWNGAILGYWLDMQGDSEEVKTEIVEKNTIKIFNIPKKKIQELLLEENETISPDSVSENTLVDEKCSMNSSNEVIVSENEGKRAITNVEVKIPQDIQLQETKDDVSVDEVEIKEKSEKNTQESLVQEQEIAYEQEDTSEECMNILFGTNDITKEEVIWKPNDTTQLFHTNTGIIGTMGTGKTQFTKSFITQLYKEQKHNVDQKEIGILIFDYKGDYNESKKDFKNATNAKVLTPYLLPFNPLSLVKTKTYKPLLPVHTANAFKDILAKAYNLGHKQQNTLFNCIMNTYKACGIERGNPNTWDNEPPTIEQVYQNYMNDEDIKKGDSLEAALGKLHNFQLFEDNPSKTESLFEILKGVVVIDLSGYDDDIQTLIVAITLELFYLQMQATGSSKMEGKYRQLTKLILVDEADNFMSKDFPALKRILKEGREFGVGTILSTQFLEHFLAGDDDYSKYILTWVVHNVSDLKNTDIDFVFKTQAKSSESKRLYEAIKELQKHHSIVKIGNEKPLYMEDKAFWKLYEEMNE